MDALERACETLYDAFLRPIFSAEFDTTWPITWPPFTALPAERLRQKWVVHRSNLNEGLNHTGAHKWKPNTHWPRVVGQAYGQTAR